MRGGFIVHGMGRPLREFRDGWREAQRKPPKPTPIFDTVLKLAAFAWNPVLTTAVFLGAKEAEGAVTERQERSEAELQKLALEFIRVEVVECLVKTGDTVVKNQLLGVGRVFAYHQGINLPPEDVPFESPCHGVVVNAHPAGTVLTLDQVFVQVNPVSGLPKRRIQKVAQATAVAARGTASAAAWVARQAEKAAQRSKADPGRPK